MSGMKPNLDRNTQNSNKNQNQNQNQNQRFDRETKAAIRNQDSQSTGARSQNLSSTSKLAETRKPTDNWRDQR